MQTERNEKRGHGGGKSIRRPMASDIGPVLCPGWHILDMAPWWLVESNAIATPDVVVVKQIEYNNPPHFPPRIQDWRKESCHWHEWLHITETGAKAETGTRAPTIDRPQKRRLERFHIQFEGTRRGNP